MGYLCNQFLPAQQQTIVTKYEKLSETLYMAVNYVDRYLSRQSSATRKSELQLIGISALFFAAKLEEIYPPKLAEFASVTDSACTETEMREMELIMLKVPNSIFEYYFLNQKIKETSMGIITTNSYQLVESLLTNGAVTAAD